MKDLAGGPTARPPFPLSKHPNMLQYLVKSERIFQSIKTKQKTP